MGVIFNELSLSSTGSVDDARAGMNNLVHCILHLKEQGIHEVRVHESVANIYDWSITNDYTVRDWKEDNIVDSVLRRRFKLLAWKFPVIDDRDEKNYEEYGDSYFYYTYNGTELECNGLGSAYLLAYPVLSLSIDGQWRIPAIGIKQYVIEGSDELGQVDCEVVNFWDIASYSAIGPLLNKAIRNRLNSLTDLWFNQSVYFPHLIFCPQIEDQLLSLSFNRQFVVEVFDNLAELNRFAKEWVDLRMAFNCKYISGNYNVRISNESESDMNKYGHERIMKLPDGSYACFEPHLKLRNGVRIHVHAIDSAREIYVGYIGPHLSSD